LGSGSKACFVSATSLELGCAAAGAEAAAGPRRLRLRDGESALAMLAEGMRSGSTSARRRGQSRGDLKSREGRAEAFSERDDVEATRSKRA